uniref:Uncharacterized protein n=1 Tax=Zea mays TaxID=4577 RepID=C4J7V7_MAIZE|nr:unknown [Zea mays]
MAWSRRRS